MKIQATLWVQEADSGGALWSVMYIRVLSKIKTIYWKLPDFRGQGVVQWGIYYGPDYKNDQQHLAYI